MRGSPTFIKPAESVSESESESEPESKPVSESESGDAAKANAESRPSTKIRFDAARWTAWPIADAADATDVKTDGDHAADASTAQDIQCYRCGQFGHISRFCPNPYQAQLRPPQSGNQTQDATNCCAHSPSMSHTSEACYKVR